MNYGDPGPLMMDYETLSLVEILGADELPAFKEQMLNDPDSLLVRGTLHRAGRAGFYYWLEHSQDVLNWNDTVFRLTPVRKKITIGLQQICEMLANEKNTCILFENKPQSWELEISKHPSGSFSKTMLYACYLAGFVQEFASWAGLGKFYRVMEAKNPLDNGNHRRIVILKEPIE
jgi:hypothetical protein